MIGRLNHVAIAVPDLDHACETYRAKLGAELSEVQELGEHGVRTVFVRLENTRIELLGRLGPNSPIDSFLARHPEGGLHHICYEVADIESARAQLLREGARILGDGKPRPGAHGKPVLFVHPKDMLGTLIELEEA